MPVPENTLDVADEGSARSAAAMMAEAPALAVDVEADAMHAFRARLCFVQVASDWNIFLFDTLAPGVRADLLTPTFADPARLKVFHAAGGDLQFLAETGVRVRGLFDTHRAATLLGWRKVGLADLVRQFFEIELAKEHQQADFAQRPLPPALREYIAADVRYLLEIGRRLQDACAEAGILEEVQLDCDRLADEALARPVVAPFQPKLPRGSMKAVELAKAQGLAQALHQKRLVWAEQANVPMGRMLSNAALIAIVLGLPADRRALSKCVGVRGGFAREHGEEVLALIREWNERAARGEVQQEPPVPRDPGARRREDVLKVWRATKATERKVTPSVVLPNALLDELVKRPPSSPEALSGLPYFGQKRLALYGAELVALLEKG